MTESETTPRGFIVGMSRSGTKWLSMCLNQHSAVAVFGETGFWGKHYVEPTGNVLSPEECRLILEKMPSIKNRRVNDAGILHVEGQATPVGDAKGGLRGLFAPLVDEIMSRKEYLTPPKLFSKMCSLVASDTGKQHVLEKTPHHLNWLGRISSAYPSAKFVVMYRDPYEFMRSYKHQGDRKGESIKEEYQSMYHPLGCALIYRGYARSVLDAARRYSDRVLLVDLGAVKLDPVAVLQEICAFFGLTFEEQCVLPPLNSSFPDERRELKQADIQWMTWVSHRELTRLGYEPRIVSVRAHEMIRSVAQIPMWGFRVLRHLHYYQNASALKYLRRWLR